MVKVTPRLSSARPALVAGDEDYPRLVRALERRGDAITTVCVQRSRPEATPKADHFVKLDEVLGPRGKGPGRALPRAAFELPLVRST